MVYSADVSRYSSYDAMSHRTIDSICDVGFPTIKTFMCPGYDLKDLSNTKEIACWFGQALLTNAVWEQRDGLKFTVEIERMTEAQTAKYLAKEEVHQEKDLGKRSESRMRRRSWRRRSEKTRRRLSERVQRQRLGRRQASEEKLTSSWVSFVTCVYHFGRALKCLWLGYGNSEE
jgi:hypothetical protein